MSASSLLSMVSIFVFSQSLTMESKGKFSPKAVGKLSHFHEIGPAGSDLHSYTVQFMQNIQRDMDRLSGQ